MIRRSRIWQAAAAVFVFINAAGAGWAIAEEDPMHAVTHLALLVAGYLAWQLIPWGRRQTVPIEPVDERRIEYLQQSVDAIALEVERIGEKQRFSDKLRVERGEVPPPKRD